MWICVLWLWFLFARFPEIHSDSKRSERNLRNCNYSINTKILTSQQVLYWPMFFFFLLFSQQKKARGRRSPLYMRSLFQSHLSTLGISVQKNAGKILFVAILVLSTFCVGLKSATIHSKVHQLWIQGMCLCYRCCHGHRWHHGPPSKYTYLYFLFVSRFQRADDWNKSLSTRKRAWAKWNRRHTNC